MDTQSQLLGTLDSLYASVLEDDAWGEGLTRLARLVGGSGAFIMEADPRTTVVVGTEAYDVDREAIDVFMRDYASKDIRIPAALSRPVGELLLDRSLITYDALRKSEIYNDFLLQFDVPYLMGLWLRKAPDSFVSLSLEAGLKRGPFTGEEVERFRLVIPHLMRVAQIRRMLDQARVNNYVSQKVLETVPFGILMLDAAGDITGSTGIAEEILKEGKALKYSRQRLRAVNGEDDAKLQAAIHSVTRAARGEGVGTTVVARRAFGALPLTLAVLPIRTPDLLDSFSRPVCLVLVIDPDRKVHAQCDAIQRSLGLSPAESRLALAVFHGLSIQQAARSLGRSYNTCKTQAKTIYAKTGCASQAELVKKIMLVCFAPMADPV